MDIETVQDQYSNSFEFMVLMLKNVQIGFQMF